MYIGTYIDKKNNLLFVSERINGNRLTTTYPLIFEYYVPDDNGYDMGYDGQRLKKITLKNINEYYTHKKQCQEMGIKTYELNFNLINKVLYKYYEQGKSPILHKSYIDIEVDLYTQKGISITDLIDKANCPINAVSIFNDWEQKLYTLMLRPDNISHEEAQQICNKFEDTYLFETENDLLNILIAILDDADVISGWNSEGFDIPYIIRRIENVLGEEETNRLCLWKQKPSCKEVFEYGKKKYEYSLIGKWSADYLILYKKHERSVKESYKLNNIAEAELGEKKVSYTGTLDDLYREDYEKFILYNRQDTMLVKKLDDKLNYIDIHNRQAHDIRCTLESTVGTVSWVDQSIINEAHNSELKIPDKVEGKNVEFTGIVAPGAYVAEPKVGLCSYVFSYDMNSLYPTSMRSLNMSPETIVAQVKLTKTIPYLWEKIEKRRLWKKVKERIPDWGAAWGGDEFWGTLEYQEIMKQSDEILTIQLETGGEAEITAKEIYNMVFAENSNLCISAFGTIFRTDKDGLLKQIFTRWYADRKLYKKRMYRYERLASGIHISEDILKLLPCKIEEKPIVLNENNEYDIDKLQNLINDKAINELVNFIIDNGLHIVDGIIEPIDKKYYKDKESYWNLEQYVKKIQLNSSYGALLNASSVFYDFRMGASTTLTGRKVVQHLTAKANELLIGKYVYKGECAQYNDTDSVYCSIDNDHFRQLNPNFDYDKDKLVTYVDNICDKINESFPEYMKKSFHCTDEGASLQKAGREVVASRGLYVSKKRYALMVYDMEGERFDVHGKPGKLKIMGLQIQRSDTPMIVRKLLKKMMDSLLSKGDREELLTFIREFYETDWNTLKPWEKGSPKAVNGLSKYTEDYKNNPNTRVPGHVMASINFNRMIEMMKDVQTSQIIDGSKIVVCKLKKNNPYGMSSIAYPRDLNVVPEWFKQLPFDETDMSDTVVDTTMDSIFGILNWNLSMKSAIQSIDNILDDFLTLV